MTLDSMDTEKIREAVRDAYRRGHSAMNEMREIARGLQPRQLAHYEASAIAFVAADGGNQIPSSGAGGGFFNPAMIEMVRVVDSQGRECMSDAIAAGGNENGDIADWREKTKTIEPLRVLCRDLRANSVGDLSPYLSGNNRRSVVEAYREIAEWASVYSLMAEYKWPSDSLLVHEGPLRSGIFHREIFERLDEQFEKAYRRQKEKGVTVSLVGISKSSAILSRLSAALALEAVFEKDYPCCAKVGKKTAGKFYRRRWLDTVETAPPGGDYLSMGEMFLVKFGKPSLSPVWTVDIARWHKHQANDVLGQLAADSRPGFPIPDFPMCVQRAHDYARVGPLEISVFSDMLTEEMTKNLSADERERLYRLKHLGEDITARRYRNA